MCNTTFLPRHSSGNSGSDVSGGSGGSSGRGRGRGGSSIVGGGSGGSGCISFWWLLKQSFFRFVSVVLHEVGVFVDTKHRTGGRTHGRTDDGWTEGTCVVVGVGGRGVGGGAEVPCCCQRSRSRQ